MVKGGLAESGILEFGAFSPAKWRTLK